MVCSKTQGGGDGVGSPANQSKFENCSLKGKLYSTKLNGKYHYLLFLWFCRRALQELIQGSGNGQWTIHKNQKLCTSLENASSFIMLIFCILDRVNSAWAMSIYHRIHHFSGWQRSFITSSIKICKIWLYTVPDLVVEKQTFQWAKCSQNLIKQCASDQHFGKQTPEWPRSVNMYSSVARCGQGRWICIQVWQGVAKVGEYVFKCGMFVWRSLYKSQCYYCRVEADPLKADFAHGCKDSTVRLLFFDELVCRTDFWKDGAEHRKKSGKCKSE